MILAILVVFCLSRDDFPRDDPVVPDVLVDFVPVEGLGRLCLLELSEVDDDVGCDHGEDDGGETDDELGHPGVELLLLEARLSGCEETEAST